MTAKYYVIWPNGQRFGPADVATLRQWLGENRIDANTTLVDAATGLSTTAGAVLQLAGPKPTTFGSPGPSMPTTGYPRMGSFPTPHRGAQTETIAAWVCGALGLTLIACCPLPLIPLVGLLFGFAGRNKGQPGALAALWFNVAILVLQAAIIVFGGLLTSFG